MFFKKHSETQQRYSIRKFKTGTFSALVGLGILASMSGQVVKADTAGSYSHKDINELSAADKALIRQGQPGDDVSANEEIIFVYQHNGQGKCKLNTNQVKSTGGKSTTGALPNTGDRTNLLLTLGFGATTLGAAVYLVAKNKKGRKTFLVLTIAGSTVIGGHTVFADSMTGLMEQIEALVKKDASAIASPQTDLNCYEYVGYIRRSAETPVTPEQPTSPVTPVVPTTPVTPTTPTTSEEPSEPTTPTTPEKPSEPTTPTTPEEPSEPTTPTTPEKPSEPTTPTTPEKPSEPTTPTTPEKPSEPTTPTTPTTPEEPSEPTTPTTPEKPSEPTTPEEPSEPTTPTTPEKPSEPTTPTTPEEPSEPTTPTTPEEPSEPTTPVAKTGSVDVKYIAEDGIVLKDTAPVLTDQAEGTDYTTAAQEFEGYEFSRMGILSAPSNGKIIADQNLHVLYVYRKLPGIQTGSVNVKYIAEDGTVLKEKSAVLTDVPVDTEYTTTQETFEGYTFSRMGTESAPAKGTVLANQTQTVIYVYAKNPEVKTGSVDVKYVTTDGTELEAVSAVKTDAPVGEAYSTEEKTFEGYRFVGMDKSSAPAIGKVTEDDQHVIYVYEKVEAPVVEKGSVDVTYIAEDGTVLKETAAVLTDAPVGTEYTTSQETFEGYTFARMGQGTAVANGTVLANQTQHVVYVYKESPDDSAIVTPGKPEPAQPPVMVVKKGTVIARYVDQEGVEIRASETVVSSDPVGRPYSTESNKYDTIQREGKTYELTGLATGSAPEEGTVQDGITTVTFMYKAILRGSVEVRYVDTNGVSIKDSVQAVKNEVVGTDYDVTAHKLETISKDNRDYTFARVEGSENGTIAEGTTVITYVYKVKTGSILVKYKDTEGTELQAEVFDMANVPTGTYYETFDHKLETITANGKTYRYSTVQGNESGTVVEGTTTVTYIYDLVKGSVVVKYVDTEGNELKTSVTAEDEVATGTEYNTASLKEATVEKDNKTYKLVTTNDGLLATSAPETGTVVEGTTTVTYVYYLPKGSVVINYVDQEGNKLLPTALKIIDEAEVGTSYDAGDAKLERLTRSGKQYRYMSTKEGSEIEKGTVKEGTTEITYVYDFVRGSVTVRFLRSEENIYGESRVIKEDVKVLTDVPVGTDYDISNLMEESFYVDYKDYGGYKLKYYYQNIKGAQTGEVVEGDMVIDLLYSKEISHAWITELSLSEEIFERNPGIKLYLKGKEITNDFSRGERKLESYVYDGNPEGSVRTRYWHLVNSSGAGKSYADIKRPTAQELFSDITVELDGVKMPYLDFRSKMESTRYDITVNGVAKNLVFYRKDNYSDNFGTGWDNSVVSLVLWGYVEDPPMDARANQL